jgi:hypothetical protein
MAIKSIFHSYFSIISPRIAVVWGMEEIFRELPKKDEKCSGAGRIKICLVEKLDQLFLGNTPI